MIYPKIYLDSITQITEELLKQNNIKGLVLDLDNTLIDSDRVLSEKIKRWCLDLKEKNVKIIILSNTNKVDKVTKVAHELELEYIYFAQKPLKSGFLRAQTRLKLKSNEIAVVGDQIFTDVIGANRCKMFSIMVKPIDENDIFMTKIKRPIENIIVKRFLKKQNRGK